MGVERNNPQFTQKQDYATFVRSWQKKTLQGAIDSVQRMGCGRAGIGVLCKGLREIDLRYMQGWEPSATSNVSNGFTQIGKHGRCAVLFYQGLDFSSCWYMLQLEGCGAFDVKYKWGFILRVISEFYSEKHLQGSAMHFMVDFKFGMDLGMLLSSIELFIKSKVEVQDAKIRKFHIAGRRFNHA